MKRLIFIPVIIFITNLSILYSQPQFIIHLTGGYDLPLPDLKGDVLDSADFFNTYTMKTGFGFGADAKYYIGKKRNIGITFSAGYQMFSTSENTVTYYEEIGHFTARDFKRKLNAITLGAGIEYAFMLKGKVNPFVGAEFTAHFFSGNYKYTAGSSTFTADLESASRFGFAGGIGVNIALSKTIGIVIGGKYHLANLIGKDSTGITATKYGLDDKEYTSPLGGKVSAKNISYIQGYVGISFYLNQPKKQVGIM